MEKPANPYCTGARFLITAHEPPPPRSPLARLIKRGEVTRITAEGFVEHCLANPPQPGRLGTEQREIVVTEELAVGDGHGAQLVAVGDSTVAKIYDPLYYPDPTTRREYDPHSSVVAMPTRAADFNYCLEAQTYGLLAPTLGGGAVPMFLGSFSMDLPCGPDRTRPVRLILMERLRGATLEADAPRVRALPLEQRQALLAKLIDAESAVFHRKVSLADFAPRNIMLCGRPGAPGFRVALFDFGEGAPLPSRSVREGANHAAAGPLSPILRWRKLPRELARNDWIDWKLLPWLEGTYKGSPAYAPITAEMEDLWIYRRFRRPNPNKPKPAKSG